jgi:probable phosphoglycerate mutase
LGILQAKKLQQECKHLHIDVIFSSPYKRAIDTCKNISKDHKLHIKTDDRLKERSFGYFEKKEVNPSSKNRICD